MADKPEKVAEPLDFTELVGRLDDGALYAQLHDELHDVVRALKQRAADKPKAKLTLVLTFAFDGKMVTIKPTVATQLPKPINGASVFWTTKENGLVPQNPAQMTMELRDAATDGVSAGGLRKVP